MPPPAPAIPGAYGIMESAPAGREDPPCVSSDSALGTVSLSLCIVSETSGESPGNTDASSFVPCSINASPVTAICWGDPDIPDPPARLSNPGLAGIAGGAGGGPSSCPEEGLSCAEESKTPMLVFHRFPPTLLYERRVGGEDGSRIGATLVLHAGLLSLAHAARFGVGLHGGGVNPLLHLRPPFH